MKNSVKLALQCFVVSLGVSALAIFLALSPWTGPVSGDFSNELRPEIAEVFVLVWLMPSALISMPLATFGLPTPLLASGFSVGASIVLWAGIFWLFAQGVRYVVKKMAMLKT